MVVPFGWFHGVGSISIIPFCWFRFVGSILFVLFCWFHVVGSIESVPFCWFHFVGICFADTNECNLQYSTYGGEVTKQSSGEILRIIPDGAFVVG